MLSSISYFQLPLLETAMNMNPIIVILSLSTVSSDPTPRLSPLLSSWLVQNRYIPTLYYLVALIDSVKYRVGQANIDVCVYQSEILVLL